ncbi:MAG: ATP-binding protein [Coprobacillus sp.]|nr:ATP-binding protein [Coprobacillus sp.]
MYLDCLKILNNGPIRKCVIHPRFVGDDPVPLIVIGENGTGKSILASYLADSFVEFTKLASLRMREIYPEHYKLVSPTNIREGEKYSLVLSKYRDNAGDFYLFEGMRDISNHFSEIEEEIKEFNFRPYAKEKIKNLNNEKYLHCDLDNDQSSEIAVSEILTHNIMLFYPSERIAHPPIGQSFKDELYNPIISSSYEEENTKWFQSVISSGSLSTQKTLEVLLEKITKSENLRIVKTTHQDSYEIHYKKNGENRILKSLNQLSSGEATLFNMFVTILRHADEGSNEPLPLEADSISGVVAIDEIEMHLDTDLQYEVLPSLIAMFPKIQFIIATHSPLFVSGMEKYHNDHNYEYDLIEMPSGRSVSIARFSEFERAYNTFDQVSNDRKVVQQALTRAVRRIRNTNPLVITEGKTDTYHLKRALDLFHQEGKYLDLNFNTLDFGKKGTLGYGKFNTIKDFISILPSGILNVKYIIICDRDVVGSGKKSSFVNQLPDRGYWQEDNVYAFKIPTPKHRLKDCQDNPSIDTQISIEHYYTDEEIKTPVVVNGIEKRLYMGNEFDSEGHHLKEDLMTHSKRKCGPTKINILDSSAGVRTTTMPNKFNVSDNTNVALSKNDFCNLVVGDPINHISYEAFSAIFDIISEISKK